MKKLVLLTSFLLLFVFGLKTNAQVSSRVDAFYKSIAAEKIGDYDEAIKILQEALSADEKSDYLYNYRLGWLYNLKGDFQNSIKYYNNAARIGGNNLEALFGLTYPYSNLGNYDKLKEIYREILKKDPGNYTANYNLGLIFFNQGDYLNAIVFLEKAYEEYPSAYGVNLYLGWANYYQGGDKKAHKYFENALIVAPNDSSAMKGYLETK